MKNPLLYIVAIAIFLSFGAGGAARASNVEDLYATKVKSGEKLKLPCGARFKVKGTIIVEGELDGCNSTLSRDLEPFSYPVLKVQDNSNGYCVEMGVDVTGVPLKKMMSGSIVNHDLKRSTSNDQTISDLKDTTVCFQHPLLPDDVTWINSGGARFENRYPIIYYGSGAVIKNLNINGGRDFGSAHYWESEGAIMGFLSSKKETLIDGVTVANSPADGIVLSGNIVLKNSVVINSGSAGVHISNGGSVYIKNNFISKSHARRIINRHSVGNEQSNIEFSYIANNVIIDGNVINGAKIGIGNLTDGSIKKVKILNNHISGSESAGISVKTIPSINGNFLEHLEIINNFISVGDRAEGIRILEYSNPPFGTNYYPIVKISNNRINAGVRIQNARNVAFKGNIIFGVPNYETVSVSSDGMANHLPRSSFAEVGSSNIFSSNNIFTSDTPVTICYPFSIVQLGTYNNSLVSIDDKVFGCDNF